MPDIPFYTQTDTVHGNCWQTAVAAILRVDPAVLPDQVAIESDNRHYANALSAYLEKHHGLVYYELEEWQTTAVRIPEPGYHLICGPTVRTADTKKQHCVIGQHGVPVWDPHPSRDGLTDVRSWGLIGALTEKMRTWRRERRAGDTWLAKALTCCCPACANGTT